MENKDISKLEEKIKWNKKHLRITFIISSLTLLALIGHFILHATGRV